MSSNVLAGLVGLKIRRVSVASAKASAKTEPGGRSAGGDRNGFVHPRPLPVLSAYARQGDSTGGTRN
jgi:hypothetical protein